MHGTRVPSRLYRIQRKCSLDFRRNPGAAVAAADAADACSAADRSLIQRFTEAPAAESRDDVTTATFTFFRASFPELLCPTSTNHDIRRHDTLAFADSFFATWELLMYVQDRTLNTPVQASHSKAS